VLKEMKDKINYSYIVLAYFSLFTLGAVDNARGPVYPQILSDFGIGTSKGAFLFSLASLTGLFVNLTARWWLPRFGVIRAIRFSLVAIALSSWSLALSGSLINYPLLLASSVSLGVGLSLCGISMNLLIVKGAPLKARRRLFSGLHATYGLSSLMTPLVFITFFKLGFNWKEFFVFNGSMSLLVLLGSFLWGNFKEESEKAPEFKSHVPKLQMLLTGTMIGFYVASEILLSSRIVFYLQTARSLTLVEASNYLSLFFLCLMLGRLSFSLFHIKLSGPKLLSLSLLSSLLLTYLGLHYHPVFLAILGGSMSFFFPVSLDYISENFSEFVDHMISSSMIYIGLVLFLIHYLFGYITEHYGADKAILLLPMCLGISLVSLIIQQQLPDQKIKEFPASL
jgi:MFS transporter, FHS family, glucose/mannose:H+ symporter